MKEIFLNQPLNETLVNHLNYNINLSSEINLDSSNISLRKDYLFFYSKRRNYLENLNLSDFIKSYYIKNERCLKRIKIDLESVVYFSPYIIAYKNSNNYYKYCS